MSIINSQPLIGASGNQSTAYNLTRSLRFRSSASAYLNRTPASAGNRRTWTWSAWVKRGILGSRHQLFSAAGASTNTYIEFQSDQIMIEDYNPGVNMILRTTAVQRDPSAWYHFVVAVDTTQATSSNRIKIYINGVQQTAFASSTYPSQNYDTAVNSAVVHKIGQFPTSSSENFDGYMAEVNFIDGQALTPSDFGETDTATGVWKPKKYTGTYGTNGFYLPFSLNQTASHSASFNGSSQYLSFPNSSNFAFGTGAFTIEGWLNGTNAQADKFLVGGRSAIGTLHITTGGSATSTTAGCLRYVGSSTITSGNILVSTGTWTHWAVTRDGSNNVKLWINGQEVGSGTDTTNYSTTSGTWFVGVNDVNTAAGLLAGNVSNLRIVKGSAVYTAKFAPPSANLTAISGTSLLTLQSSTIVDNSGNSVSITNTGSIAMSVDYPFSSNVSYDASGNNNNWVANNISLTSGSTYDSMKDVPTLTDADTANYCVLSPLWTGSPTISNGNLQITSASSSQVAIGSLATAIGDTGKYYFEYEYTSTPSTNGGGGVWDTNSTFSAGGVADSGTGTRYVPAGVGAGNIFKFVNGSSTLVGTYASYTTGDVIGVAFDCSAGTVSYYKNNTLQVTITDSTNFTGKAFAPYMYVYAGNVAVNFGQRPFAYTPPSGFKALNTFNLPTPTIGATASTQANKYFDIKTYTGTGSSLNITGLGFQPDLVWIKERNAAADHALYDAVRGVQKQLESNTTTAETTESTGLTAFNSDGFTVGGLAQVNTNTDTYVASAWDANGAGSSNTAGSITSTVSANTTAGFSIATFTAPSSGAFTVGHGLGVAPNMIIVKSRSNAYGWPTYHQSIGNASRLDLNTTSGITTTQNSAWNNTSPTSTVFSMGSDWAGSGITYVAYCFAEVAGYSRFGNYTGNGSTDGPFVFCGFRPKFIIMKRTNSGTVDDWMMMDSARSLTNVATARLLPNSGNAEATDAAFDFLSNGFKIRDTNASSNANGGTYIFAAFAENPFKYSLAR